MSVPYIPEGVPPVMPYLVVHKPEKVLDFAVKVLGAEIIEEVRTPDGVLNHGEFRIGSSIVMIGVASEQNKPFPCMLYVYVPDVDATYKHALEQNAKSLAEPQVMFYGDRMAGVEDDQGIIWWISTHVEDVSSEELQRRMNEAKQQG